MTILTKPRNLQSTMQTLMLLPDVDIVRLARDQGWWIPQYYPFIFPGHARSGPRELPPVLTNCTANDKSLKLLKLFVKVEGRCDLPRNIVLVHENLSRSFLPETVLTPPAHTFNYEILPSVFSRVSGNQDQSDQSSSSVDQNQSDDDHRTMTVMVVELSASSHQDHSLRPELSWISVIKRGSIQAQMDMVHCT